MLGFEITSVQNLGDYRLALVFADRRAGQVDLRSYIQKAGVFTRFADMQYFNSVYLNPEFGTLCWPDNVDLLIALIHR